MTDMTPYRSCGLCTTACPDAAIILEEVGPQASIPA